MVAVGFLVANASGILQGVALGNGTGGPGKEAECPVRIWKERPQQVVCYGAGDETRDWTWWRREREDLNLTYLPQWPTSFSGRLGYRDEWWEDRRWRWVAVPAEVFEKGFL